MLPPLWRSVVNEFKQAIKDKSHEQANITAALNRFANAFEADNTRRETTESRKKTRENWTIAALAAAAAFTFALDLLGFFQWKEMQRAYEQIERSADAAKKSADVAERALVQVERPILALSMPQGRIKAPPGVLNPDVPTYEIEAENVGKQIAIVVSGNANYTVESNSAIPEPVLLGKPDDTWCHIRIVGEVIIRQGAKQVFVCQRSKALTPIEIRGLSDDLYGFFRIVLVYADPVGTLRASVFIFHEYPPGNGINHPTFIQVYSKDIELDAATPNEQKDAQRILVGGLLKFYRDFDRGQQTLPLPLKLLPWPNEQPGK
jgi:hypothetical protein